MESSLIKPSRSPMGQMRQKQAFLYSLIASAILGGLIGIVVVLRGEWGAFEVRVILTTITIAVASLSGLACDMARRQRRAVWLPDLGLALTAIAAVMLLIGIWGEVSSQLFWKLTASASILTASTVHVCMLRLAELARQFRWVFGLAALCSFTLAAMLVTTIFGEIDSEPMFRAIVAVSIVNAVMTLIVPLLHRISRTQLPSLKTGDASSIAKLDAEIVQLRKLLVQAEAKRAELTSGSCNVGRQD